MMQTFSVESNGQVMLCNVVRSRGGHVSLRGSLNGEERLQCDMTTTFDRHPDRFARECRDVALNRLRQIQKERTQKS
jgi:hypothetical protein